MTTLATLAAAIMAVIHPGQPVPQIVCYPNPAAYFAASRIQPQRFWPGGVAGFWGVPSLVGGGYGPVTIGLTAQECTNLAAIRSGYTWQRGYSAFVFGHEIGHALYGSDETIADQAGLRLAPQIAYALGLRGHATFARLHRDLSQLVPEDQ